MRLAKDLILRQFNVDRYVVPHIEDKVNDRNGKVTSSMTFNFTGAYSPSPMGNELPLTQVVDHPIPEHDYLVNLETKLNDTLQESEAKGLGRFGISRNDHSCTVLFTADPGFTDEQKQSFVENQASILSALLPKFSTSQRQ